MDIRMPAINRVSLSGNLADDPKELILDSGQHLVSFQIAVDERYRDRSGEWQSKTHWVSVTAWGKLAEKNQGKLHKGSPVIVDGALTTNEWKDKHDQKRKDLQIRAFSIQRLERTSGSSQGSGTPYSNDEGF